MLNFDEYIFTSYLEGEGVELETFFSFKTDLRSGSFKFSLSKLKFAAPFVSSVPVLNKIIITIYSGYKLKSKMSD